MSKYDVYGERLTKMTEKSFNTTKFYIALIVTVLFVVFFGVLVIGIYSSYNRFIPADVSEYAYDVPDTLEYYIDYIETKTTHTYIYGWAHSDKRPFSYPSVILYDTKDKTFHKLVTTSVGRPDLIESYGSDYEKSGFVATIDNKYLTSEYQVMLTYPCGEKEVLVTTDHYFTLEEQGNE